MSKTSVCIQMLQVLNSRGIVQISELADILETNPRNILEYKKELEYSGYYIDTIPGRYGGYILNQKYLLPSPKLTEAEKSALLSGSEFLRNRNDFMDLTVYNRAVSKIFSISLVAEDQHDMTIINRFPLAMPKEDLEKRYYAIQQCILNQQILNIDYLSLKNTVRTHRLHPYKLYMYNNAWFVLGWNETKGDVGYFKVNRIQNFEILNEKFESHPYFVESHYLDQYGMKNNGEWYRVKFIAYNQYASLVKERIYGKNQVITEENDYTIVAVDMQSKENIKVFIMGFGVHAKVIEPQWLIEDIKNEVSALYSLYP